MIPIAKPLLGEKEADAAREAVLSGWVAQGPRVKEFEEAFADYVGAKYACAVSSCTAALHMALLALGVRPGNTVITVSHSFIATANCIRHCGAEPLFVDIDPATYNIDADQVGKILAQDCIRRDGGLYYQDRERLMQGESPLRSYSGKDAGRVAAIMPVHQMGLPCDIQRIQALGRQYNIPVIEDAACAAGSAIRNQSDTAWERIGSPHADIACFSFHPRKVLTTGEGGMLTSNDPGLAAQFKLLRQHGMSVPDTVRHSASKVIIEEYLTTAYNYRMTDIQAAVGLVQLARLDDMVAERQRLAAEYKKLLAGIQGIRLLQPGKNIYHNWQSYPVRLDRAESCLPVMQKLLDAGIATRQGIMNSHAEAPYRAANWRLAQSDSARAASLLLPLYCGMEAEQQEQVASSLRQICKAIP